MKRTVRWLLVRHGAHKDGHLTEEGKRQVRESVSRHLTGVDPDYAFSSELERALETVTVTVGTLGTQKAPAERVVMDPGFGFAFPERVLLPDFPYAEANRRVQAAEATGMKVSVYDIFTTYWPPALMIGGMLYATMRSWSARIALERACAEVSARRDRPEVDECVCLAGTHGSMVYATLNPKATSGNPGYGEIMEYVFEVDEDGDAKLVSSKLLTSAL